MKLYIAEETSYSIDSDGITVVGVFDSMQKARDAFRLRHPLKGTEWWIVECELNENISREAITHMVPGQKYGGTIYEGARNED